MIRLIFLTLFVGATACAGSTVIEARPEAARIELVSGEPDRARCAFLGDVQGEAKSSDVGEANQYARNDMKNKAHRIGANVVTIDTNTAANAMDWTGRNMVVLAGRGFRCR